MNVGNLADLAQLRAIRTGDRRNKHLSAQLQRPIPALALLPTEHNVPFNYNFHQGDLPHFFVVGPSRSGKTTLLNFLISQFFKYHPCNVLIFDKDYAFFCIDEMLTLDPTAAIKPTLIYLEEVWYLLKNKKLRERFDNWLRTLAKKNAIVGMTTQSLAEIADSDIFTTIIDNIQNRIFLPNPSVMAHLDLYRDKFQLNDEQIERIRTAKRKVQYYFVNPEGMSRMVNVKFPPEMLACLRSDQLARMKYEEFRAKLVPDWQEQYIEELVRIGEAAESE
ncbi:hypothetical protein M3795_16070 [Ralstonia pickettii]|uniref:hypothetical protein n=1 Tax=Ralstonia pickettii TaxID=329 RepID=UPI002041B06F|nr:hypothetical protein [Ralstonia pickettii]MCM3582002.1 hypothetical protein [Ralstonia pickettii]